MISNFLKRMKHIALERLYFFFAFFLGIIFLFLIPPFQVPDEGAHYFKALQLAQGQLTCTTQVSAPVNYVSLPSDVQLVKIKGEERKKVSGSKSLDALTTPSSSEMIPVPLSVCSAFPTGYIPQALGLKIGILSGIPPLVSFYFGRFLTLCIAIYILYYAIRLAPFGKIVFFLVGLLPITLQQISSLSYDALHISCLLLFISYALKLSVIQRELTKKELLFLFFISFFALNAKQGYIFLALLVFLLSKSHFSSAKKYWLYTLSFVVIQIIIFFFSRLYFVDPTSAFAKGVDPNMQLLGVMKNPIHFLYVVFHSLYKNFFFYFETSLLKPGWMDISLPDLLYFFMAISFTLFLRSKDEEVPLNTRQRCILFFVGLVQLVFVFLSLYMVWTKVGSGRVAGVQGRYFLVLFPLFIFSFYKSKFHFRSEWIKENMSLSLIIFSLIVFSFVFIEIFQLYYKSVSSYF